MVTSIFRPVAVSPLLQALSTHRNKINLDETDFESTLLNQYAYLLLNEF